MQEKDKFSFLGLLKKLFFTKN